MTLKDKPSDIFGIILLTPEELETGAGACTETVEIGYFMRFFNFCAFLYLYTGRSGNYFRGLQALSFIRFHLLVNVTQEDAQAWHRDLVQITAKLRTKEAGYPR